MNINVTVHTGTESRREISITGHATCKKAVATKLLYTKGWTIYMDDGAVLASEKFRGVEFAVLDYLKDWKGN